MIQYIYKTTNLINGKIYVGKHQAETLDNSYLGSGDLIKKAIRKYGRKSFKKEILEICNSSIEAYDREAKIVNEEFIDRTDTYNLKIGGEGGSGITPWNKGKTLPQEMKDKISKTLTGRVQPKEEIDRRAAAMIGRTHSNETKLKMSRAKLGKKFTESHKNKLSLAAKNRKSHGNQGKKNKVVECPHCKVKGGAGVMKRWHFDNCKTLP